MTDIDREGQRIAIGIAAAVCIVMFAAALLLQAMGSEQPPITQAVVIQCPAVTFSIDATEMRRTSDGLFLALPRGRTVGLPAECDALVNGVLQ